MFSMVAFVCRNCQVSMPRYHAVRLFGTKAATKRLSLRICDLLDAPVGVNDGRSECTCEGANEKFALAMVSLHFEVSIASSAHNSKIQSPGTICLLRPEDIIAALTDLLLRLRT